MNFSFKNTHFSLLSYIKEYNKLVKILKWLKTDLEIWNCNDLGLNLYQFPFEINPHEEENKNNSTSKSKEHTVKFQEVKGNKLDHCERIEYIVK